MKQKLEKWLGWMDTIQADIRGVLVAQRMHHELQEIIDTNSDLPETNDLYGRLGSTYTSHVVIGLRRQLKTGDEQVSLAAMFKEMIATPQAVTRTYYRSHYTDSNVADLAGGHFDQFASTGASHIDQSRVQADFDELKCVTAKCEEYADRRVAHMDKRKPRSAPTYLELDAAIVIAHPPNGAWSRCGAGWGAEGLLDGGEGAVACELAGCHDGSDVGVDLCAPA